MKEFKKGDKVEIIEEGGRYTTNAKFVKHTDDGFAQVKLTEPRWLLSEDIMLARKGTVITVSLSRLK